MCPRCRPRLSYLALAFALSPAVGCEQSEADKQWMNCRGGNATACTSLGDDLRAQENSENSENSQNSQNSETRNAQRAWQMYERGCGGGDFKACLAMSQMQLRAEGVTQDVEAALKRLEEHCGRDQTLACDELGRIHQTGDNVDANPRLAADFYSAGCGARPDACPTRDLALKLYEEACTAGDAEACVLAKP